MRTFALIFALTAGAVRAADPSAVITAIACDDATGRITVTYTLSDADAIVTFGGAASPAAETWTNLSESAFRDVSGDVNRLVTAGSGRKIVWTPSVGDSLLCANGFKARLTLWSPSAPPDFLSAEIDGAKELRYYVSEAALPCPIADKYWKMDRILFRKIPAKDVVWVMGSISASRYVRLKHDYYIGVYPYTKMQAYEITSLDTRRPELIAPDSELPLCPLFYASYYNWRGTAPDDKTASYPIAEGSNFDVVRGKIALAVDFPTEAEWEYAARAGTGAALYTGKAPTAETVDEVAWYSGNGGTLHDVGRKVPNRWGLHDLLGSVNEWCLDYYAAPDNSYFAGTSFENPAEDPVGPTEGQVITAKGAARVTRGAYFGNGLTELSRGLNYRYSGSTYIVDTSAAFGVRFCAPIPGASAAKIENGTGRWKSLDTSVKTSYWDCTEYENPAIIEVERELVGVDCRRCASATSEEVEPEGVFDSTIWTAGISNSSKLNSWPPTGLSVIIR